MAARPHMKGLAPHERAKLKAQTATQKSHSQAATPPSTEIVDKLQSLEGVKVFPPRLVPYSESGASEAPASEQPVYPSPPTTADMRGKWREKNSTMPTSQSDSAEAAMPMYDAPAATGWAARPVAAPHDDSWTPVPVNNGLVRDSAANSARQTTQNVPSKRGRGGRLPRESRWPKNSDIPKGDPKRHEITWSSEGEHETELDSNRASSGWGTHKKRAEGEVALGDWGGNFAPAPIDWDSRPGFHDHLAIERIKEWLLKTDTAFETIKQPDLTQVFGAYSFNASDVEEDELDNHLQGDAAPRYWAPQVIGDQTAKDFWESLLTSKDPEPVDEDDCKGAKPWWMLYQSNGCHFLQHNKHPVIKGMDPDETQTERLARANDLGNLSFTENRRALEKAKREAAAERKRLISERTNRILKSKGNEARLNKIVPDVARFFLRSARAEDMTQVRDIYNKHIDSTVVVPETTHRTEKDMERRRHNIKLDKMHFVVACERGQVIKGRKKHKTEDIVLADKILGFAYVDDWHDVQGIYRFTLSLDIFVHQEYHGKGIGSCLLDKMLGLLHPFYLERGGYETQGEELDGVGTSRVCKEIMVLYPYDAEKKEKLGWVGGWLGKWPGFKKVGDLQGIGYKFDKTLNMAMFQRSTGARIDPANPPVTMAYPQ